jgi:hypothetical protein
LAQAGESLHWDQNPVSREVSICIPVRLRKRTSDLRIKTVAVPAAPARAKLVGAGAVRSSSSASRAIHHGHGPIGRKRGFGTATRRPCTGSVHRRGRARAIARSRLHCGRNSDTILSLPDQSRVRARPHWAPVRVVWPGYPHQPKRPFPTANPTASPAAESRARRVFGLAPVRWSPTRGDHLARSAPDLP